jgi:RimJ/RimL family protein N-acetyltransferase
MREYKCLSKQTYSLKEYQIVPIRDEDRYDIMQWRNEQIYHLRQSKSLNKESQDHYFNSVIENLFEKEYPEQILFSYLNGSECIGYGGLVHINWIDKNAELSFLLNTNENQNNFIFHWSNFLKLIENVSFIDLSLHKIYTYAFDLRPKLYKVLEDNGFYNEARLIEHCWFNEHYIDVVIHSKMNPK